jgi:hypothetical protein
MLQNDRKNLELDRLQVEVRTFIAEDMRSPTPTATRAILLPFGLGVALALVTVVAVALVVRLV